ncbi:MAG TPA: DNA polymerase I, partial [Bacilli bacterium]|nr:DNA polymerase I [Bacilli bacterium]
PTKLSIEDIKYEGPNDKLQNIYEDLEFYSFIKNIDKKVEKLKDIKIIKDISELDISNDIAIYLELDNINYHTSSILGMAIYNEDVSAFIPLDILKQNPKFLIENKKYTYDLKKVIVALKNIGLETNNYEFDTMIAAYLLNYNVKDDIAYLANTFNYDISFFESIYKAKSLDMNVVAEQAVKKAKFIYETKDEFLDKLKKEECLKLFNDIEMPLVYVLADMEYTGIKVDKKILEDMQEEIKIKLELLEEDIYNMAGNKFNINSYKQLGEILFDKLNVPSNRKRSTDKSYLARFQDDFPIIKKILEYKMLSKIYGTYIVGLKDYILKDGKIHTIYNQTLTRTGRLSSSEPNLQNIPTRYEYGRLVRKAFVPENDIFISSDYSQIELRVFAHYSKVPNLVDAFKKGMDIHTKTAMDIFGVKEKEVNSNMRRQAKAVNFGILYGISGFGLSENLDINYADAKEFLEKYLDAFPGIRKYMEKVIKEAHEKGYVTTLMNRKRVIEELNNKNYMIKQSGERMALNTPIQGTSADIIKKAMIDLYNKFKKLDLKSKMILQIHDELIFDVIKGEKKELEKIIRDIMENCYKLDVPLKVEITEGSNWYETK